MNKIYTIIFAALLLAAPVLAQETPDSPQHAPQLTCEQEQIMNGYPSYYCDCDEQRKKNGLMFDEHTKFDTIITDTTWYASNTSLFLNGFTAYLYSDASITLTVMQTCKSTSSDKFYLEYVINSNQARDITADAINQKLEQNGFTEAPEIGVRVRISPAEPGKEARFICTPYNHGPASTCNDCLPLLPNMVFVSSHDGDVYELDPQQIDENAEVNIEWFQAEYYTAFAILRGECQSVVDVYDLEYEAEAFVEMDPDDTYTIASDLLQLARENNEKLYLYFGHYGNGRVRLNVVNKPSGPTTDINKLTTDTPAAKLVLDANGMLYIVRGNETYTITGQKR